jgi:hypothetical protein
MSFGFGRGLDSVGLVARCLSGVEDFEEGKVCFETSEESSRRV